MTECRGSWPGVCAQLRSTSYIPFMQLLDIIVEVEAELARCPERKGKTPPSYIPCMQLPDIIVEAEAELARCGGWERAFPCLATPSK